MFVEIHLPLGLPVDRDDVEDAVAQAIDGIGEVVGAGTGELGSNLDLEFDDDQDGDVLKATLTTAVRSLGVTGAEFRVEGAETWEPM